ncbi:MAG: ribose 5-phosphate isomerase B [Thermodesulfobacteriota bacterium]
MPEKNIYLGSDHAGLELKGILFAQLQNLGYEVQDLGTHTQESCHYPYYAALVCRRVLQEKAMGLLVCGTGLGMSMTANRFTGIRAALCATEFAARMAREHNNANILCLGSRVTGVDLAQSILQAFLQARFQAGRHQERVQLMDELPAEAV